MDALSKPQKILAVMYSLSDGESKSLQYEDIVVAAFKRYPQDFQMRGYPQYPDNSDLHKPLYKMKKEGLLRVANKTFQLTERGLDVARQFLHTKSSDKDRLTKQEEQEIKRITGSAAFRFFSEGQRDAILDTDFYEYIGATVRSEKLHLLGRLSTVEHAVKSHKARRNDQLSSKLLELHAFLTDKFKNEIGERK